MFKKVSKTFLILSITMGASFLSTVILGRKLDTAAFGLYNLVKKFILLGPSIGLLGMSMSFTRLYADRDIITYKVFRFVYFISFITSFVIALVIFFIYDFTYLQTGLVLLIIWLTSITKFNTQYYRLKNKYLMGQFILSGWKLNFLIIISAFFLLHISIKENLLLLIFVSSFLIPFMVIFFYIPPKSNAKQYTNTLTKLYKFGFIYWLVNSIRMLAGQIENFAIPIVASNKLLGIYSALSFFFIISLKVISTSYGYVIFPEVSKGKKLNWKNIIILFSAVSLAALIIFPIFGDKIIDLLFDGKYNQYLTDNFLILFTLIGIMKSIYPIFHHYILGKGEKRDLIIYIVLSFLSVILYIISLVLLEKFFQVNLESIIYLTFFIRLMNLSLISILLVNLLKRTNKN